MATPIAARPVIISGVQDDTQRRRQPEGAARIAAGRLAAETTAQSRTLGRADSLRRYRAAQRRLKPRGERDDAPLATHE